MPRIRAHHIQLYRLSGWVFITAAYFTGITAAVLSVTKTLIGGMNEAVATVFFSIFFLTCVSQCLYRMARKQELLYRKWMVRAFSLGLAIATVRLITVVAFIFFKLPPQTFLGTAFWMGFTLHALAAEAWICYTSKPIHKDDSPHTYEEFRKSALHQ